MSRISKRERVWENIFAGESIPEKLDKEGWAVIDMATIKEKYKEEPRLLAKIDAAEYLPQIFRQHDAAVLSLSNSQYAILRLGDQGKPLFPSLTTRRFWESPPQIISTQALQSRIATIPWERDFTSESQALDAAIAAKILKNSDSNETKKFSIIFLDAFASKFAKLMEVHPDTIRKWVRGDRLLKGENLKRVAEILKISTDYLVFGKQRLFGTQSVSSSIDGPFPGYHEVITLPLEERPLAVFTLAAHALGYHGLGFSEEGIKQLGQRIPYDDYLRGEIDETALYKRAKEFYAQVKETLDMAVKKWERKE
jgi:transcriptional regulator with XRE-family HTH domain